MTDEQFKQLLESNKPPEPKSGGMNLPPWTSPLLLAIVAYFLMGVFDKNADNPVTFATLKAQVDANTTTLARLTTLESQVGDLKSLAQNTATVINELKVELKDGTSERFTLSDSKRELAPIREDITELKEELKDKSNSQRIFMDEVHERLSTMDYTIKRMHERLSDVEK